MADASESFMLPLSLPQVRAMVTAVASQQSGTGPLRLLLALTGSGGEPLKLSDFAGDERYESGEISQAVIHCLIVLGAFANREEKGVRELAREIGMTSTTAGRYLRTWVELGVLEQDQRTHRYRPAADWS